MTPERWQQVSRIIHETLARQPEDRAGFLDSVCLNDQSLRREVESLLAHESSAASFMSTRAGALADGGTSNGPSMMGRHLGRFAIQALLGAGG